MKGTLKWLAVVCVVALVLSVNATALAQLRFGRRGAPPPTRDMLVDRFGLSSKQADKVIKVHERHAAKIEKVQEKLRQQTENIRKSEMKALSRIVNKDQMRELERFLRRGPRPFGPGQRGPQGRGRDAGEPRGLGLPLAGWQERLDRLKNVTPEQREKLEALMKSHREQLRTLQDRLRKNLRDILTSEQMDRFRSRLDDARQRVRSRPRRN